MKRTSVSSGLRASTVALALLGSLGATTPAFAGLLACGTVCAAQVRMGGVTTNVQVNVGADGIGRVSNFEVTVNGLTARITSATLNPDPRIDFANVAINASSGPQAFSFLYQIPIDLSGTINASSEISYTLMNTGLPGTGAALAPGGSQNTVLVAHDFTDTLDKVNKGVDVGPRVSSTQTLSVHGPFSATNTFSGGPFTLMTVDIAFVLGGNDTATFIGNVQQEAAVTGAVPEPMTLLLMASGLLGFAGWRRLSARV